MEPKGIGGNPLNSLGAQESMESKLLCCGTSVECISSQHSEVFKVDFQLPRDEGPAWT